MNKICAEKRFVLSCEVLFVIFCFLQIHDRHSPYFYSMVHLVRIIRACSSSVTKKLNLHHTSQSGLKQDAKPVGVS